MNISKSKVIWYLLYIPILNQYIFTDPYEIFKDIVSNKLFLNKIKKIDITENNELIKNQKYATLSEIINRVYFLNHPKNPYKQDYISPDFLIEKIIKFIRFQLIEQ